MNSFKSPAEYLVYLQGVYAKHIPSGSSPDEEFKRLTQAELKERGIPLAENDPFAGHEMALKAISDHLIPTLDRATQQRVQTQIAMGLIRSGEINAFIAISPEGHYALLISSGLMTLIHKFFKLIRASIDPSDVTHCNRKPANELTADDLRTYTYDLIEAYKQYRIPYGVMIKLSPEANAQHSIALHLAEIFIVCHELGHFLNGDLLNQQLHSALPHGAVGSEYVENVNHALEYGADATGYGLYQNYIKQEGLRIGPLDALKPVLSIFNLLFGLAGGASSTHPHPYDRALNIVNNYYGAETAAQLAAALADPDLFPEFFGEANKSKATED